MIGLNYTYVTVKGKKILKNYLLFSGLKNKIITSDYIPNNLENEVISSFQRDIKKHKLYEDLQSSEYNNLFEHALIKDIMILGYDHEVKQKYKKQKIKYSPEKNKKIYEKICLLYDINPTKIITKFTQTGGQNISTYKKLKKITTSNTQNDIETFTNFIKKNIGKKHYQLRKESNIKINYQKQNSSYIKKTENGFILNLNNTSKTTLFHELTHISNHIFMTYDQQKESNSFKQTEKKEGYANCVAFNGLHAINTNSILEVNKESCFFPIYSYIYKELRKANTENIYEKEKIIKSCLKLVGQKPNLAKNIYYRFHKFFDSRENYFFYPKELLYQTGYEKAHAILKNRPHTIIDMTIGKELW